MILLVIHVVCWPDPYDTFVCFAGMLHLLNSICWRSWTMQPSLQPLLPFRMHKQMASDKCYLPALQIQHQGQRWHTGVINFCLLKLWIFLFTQLIVFPWKSRGYHITRSQVSNCANCLTDLLTAQTNVESKVVERKSNLLVLWFWLLPSVNNQIFSWGFFLYLIEV